MGKRTPFPVEAQGRANDEHSTMTRDAADTPNGDISTAAEFESALQALLRAALENGLDLRGA